MSHNVIPGRLLSLLVFAMFCLAPRSVQAQVNLLTVSNTTDSGPGSLRQAILEANLVPGTTITFNIPGPAPAGGAFTITRSSALPAIAANGTIIDGTTQTAFTGDTNSAGPEIVISGGNSQYGLEINAANCVVKGVVITNSWNTQLRFSGANATGNRVEKCYLGVNAAATQAASASPYGVALLDGAHDNLIGGTSSGLGNIIYGFTYGVLISGAGSNNNRVQGNFINTDASAAGKLLDTTRTGGVLINGGASGNVIGGTATGEANRIAWGVAVKDNSVGNTIRGNAMLGSITLGTPPILGPLDNDAGDGDTGPNHLQNYPPLGVVTQGSSSGPTYINGVLDSIPNSSFTIDFYRSTSDPERRSSSDTNFATGSKTYFGTTNVTTGADGKAQFSFAKAGMYVRQYFFATATDAAGNTSYHSSSRYVNTAPVLNTTMPPMALQPIDQGVADTDNLGTRVSSIINSDGWDRITDADSSVMNTSEGLAIVGQEAKNGTWQYSWDSGATWQDMGPVAETSARLLPGRDINDDNIRIRFRPQPGFSGTAGLTVRAWDWNDGNAPYSIGANASNNGGCSGFSTAVTSATITVVATPAPTAPAPLLISEFRLRGPD
ncbi:MAG: hypothetical protein M3347_05245, partial [Armatimonadota bacterium]|nr:hypothetical protein [Armatimonadota bacterium]